jgi:hypothetical protein
MTLNTARVKAEMSSLTKEDCEMLKNMPLDTLLNLFHMHIRNIWRVDGLYFLGIEQKFGTEAATQIDTDCWKILGKLEARELKTLLKLEKNDVPSLMLALKHTSWSLSQEQKEIEVSATRGIYRVVKCRTQQTRISKGLGEFPCKNVRFSYLKSFAEEFNPDIQVNCQICPPGKHSPNVWCQWEFALKKRLKD